MNESIFYGYLLIGWIALSVIIFISLFFIVAPYGRHISTKIGTTVSSTLGWVIMESTSPVIFAICFIVGRHPNSLSEILLLILWEAHYIHRAYIYPLHIRGGEKPMPLTIICLGFVFNGVNAYLNGRYVFTFSSGYSLDWLIDPRFIAGLVVFVSGFIINRHSDMILRSLREPGKSEYQVTNKGLFRWVSCPNYLGEILIWTGWAIASWSIAGLSFALWTIANLVPRARAHHRWYKQHFSDYPEKRRALVPLIW